MRRPTIVACWLAAALTLHGCAAPPEKEMTQARTALSAARQAGAERYAAEEYGQAASALGRSETFAAQHDYRQALSAALDARERAQVAEQAARERKEAARLQAVAALDDIEAAIAEARQVIEADAAAAPVPRAQRVYVSDLRRAIVVSNVALQKARAAMSEGDYPAASAAMEGVSARLRAVVADKPAPPPVPKPRRRR